MRQRTVEETALNTQNLKRTKELDFANSERGACKRRSRLFPTCRLIRPNPYVQALQEDYKHWAFTEAHGPLWKGKWRSEVFQVSPDSPMDLEIGVGNGQHFAFHAQKEPQRSLVGIDIKYKPLVQSIRRALNCHCHNARVVRFHALDLQELFEAGELDHLFIYFPDPWVTPRKPKKRILSESFLEQATFLQRKKGLIQFKTDSEEYFFWSKENVLRNKQYLIRKEILNLHHSPEKKNNFVTTFEDIFLKQNKPIFYLELEKR